MLQIFFDRIDNKRENRLQIINVILFICNTFFNLRVIAGDRIMLSIFFNPVINQMKQG